MSAGQTVRRSLRAGRVRIALGVTGAAAALAIGGSFTAHADNSAPAPKPVPAKGTPADQCPEPVEAGPNGIADAYKGKQVSYTILSNDPVDAVPGDDCTAPDPSKGAPVDAKPAPAKR